MIRCNHHPALVHTLWVREKNTKKNENLIVKLQQAAANNIICSSTVPVFLFSRTSRQKKKEKKTGEATNVVPGIWYAYHIKDALDNQEHTGDEAGCKRSRERGTNASFTCVLLWSCRDVRRPRYLSNAKTAAIIEPHPDGTTKKQKLVFRRSPHLGGILKH